jgi:hypothetical protein
VLAALAAASALASAGWPGARAVPLARFDDERTSCSTPLPEAAHVPEPVDRDLWRRYRVAVAIDEGIPDWRAEQILDLLEGAYRPVHIDVEEAGPIRHITLHSNDADTAIATTKAFFAGRRPPGSDAVLTITHRDLTDPTLGSSIAGLADCVGGVAFPDRAFAVAEDNGDAPVFQYGPISTDGNIAAKSAAHELGHLLGARHEYANCAEGTTSEVGEASPCTLMGSVANLDSLAFGTVETAIVRGYADEYLRTL